MNCPETVYLYSLSMTSKSSSNCSFILFNILSGRMNLYNIEISKFYFSLSMSCIYLSSCKFNLTNLNIGNCKSSNDSSLVTSVNIKNSIVIKNVMFNNNNNNSPCTFLDLSINQSSSSCTLNNLAFKRKSDAKGKNLILRVQNTSYLPPLSSFDSSNLSYKCDNENNYIVYLNNLSISFSYLHYYYYPDASGLTTTSFNINEHFELVSNKCW